MKRLITVLMLAIISSAQTATIVTDDMSINTAPTLRVMISGPQQILLVNDKDGALMVRIDNAGKVTYGHGYTPDAGARTFWEALAKYYPSVCVPPAKVPSKEVHK